MYMRTLFIPFLFLVTLVSCSKSDEQLDVQPEKVEESTSVSKTPVSYPKYYGANPIIGKWYIGPYTMYCGSDTIVYPNNNGNYIEFKSNDTAYYTYVTTNSWGWSPYYMIKENTFLLNGVVLDIVSINNQKMVLHSKENGRLVYTWELFKDSE